MCEKEIKDREQGEKVGVGLSNTERWLIQVGLIHSVTFLEKNKPTK